MMIKVAVSDCFKLKMIPSFRSVFFPEKQEIHYIVVDGNLRLWGACYGIARLAVNTYRRQRCGVSARRKPFEDIVQTFGLACIFGKTNYGH